MGCDIRRQNLTSADVRLWRLKSVPALKGLIIKDEHLSFVLRWINSSDLNIVIKKRAIWTGPTTTRLSKHQNISLWNVLFLIDITFAIYGSHGHHNLVQVWNVVAGLDGSFVSTEACNLEVPSSNISRAGYLTLSLCIYSAQNCSKAWSVQVLCTIKNPWSLSK